MHRPAEFGICSLGEFYAPRICEMRNQGRRQNLQAYFTPNICVSRATCHTQTGEIDAAGLHLAIFRVSLGAPLL